MSTPDEKLTIPDKNSESSTGEAPRGQNKTSLYDRLGGEAAIDAAVDIFYKKVTNDERIRHFFADTDVNRLARHQKRFLSYAFGGLPEYKGNGLRIAHKSLVEDMGLNDGHFDAVLENLAATLEELQVPQDLIAEAAAIAESTRDEVLNKDNGLHSIPVFQINRRTIQIT